MQVPINVKGNQTLRERARHLVSAGHNLLKSDIPTAWTSTGTRIFASRSTLQTLRNHGGHLLEIMRDAHQPLGLNFHNH